MQLVARKKTKQKRQQRALMNNDSVLMRPRLVSRGDAQRCGATMAALSRTFATLEVRHVPA